MALAAGISRNLRDGQRLSRISCWRIGILSIVREISRTVHGDGLRSLMPPSLPISTKPKPRGCNAWRRVDRASGSVSTRTITSRSTRPSSSSSISSIWRTKAGSYGLSANTINGRCVHLNSARSAVRPSRITASVISVSCAQACGAVTDNNIANTAASRVMAPPVALEIGAMSPITKLFSAEMSGDGRPASIGGTDR